MIVAELLAHTGGNADRNVNSSPRVVWHILSVGSLDGMDWEVTR